LRALCCRGDPSSCFCTPDDDDPQPATVAAPMTAEPNRSATRAGIMA
jgi:hypothetical protein